MKISKISYGDCGAQHKLNEKTFDPVELFSDPYRKGNSIMACEYEDGTAQVHAYYGCGANICYFKQVDYGTKIKKITALYMSLWCLEGTKWQDYEDFWSFCMDKKVSPWRSCLKGSEIIYDGDKPIAVKLTDMDAPFQVIASLFFTLRMGYQQDGFLRSYNRMRDKNFKRINSLYLAANFAVTKNDVVAFPYIGDYPFDTAWDNIDYQAWVDGKPKNLTDMTINSSFANYRPLNVIWSKDKTTSGGNSTSTGRKWTKVQELVGEEYDGVSFGIKKKRIRFLSVDDAVKKLKATDSWKA